MMTGYTVHRPYLMYSLTYWRLCTFYLSHLLSVTDDIFLGWPRLISDQEISKVVLELKNGSYKYNYAINHLVYEKKTTPLLFNSLPDDPIVKVTLLREPAEQLRSSFNYYNILREENDKGWLYLTWRLSRVSTPEDSVLWAHMETKSLILLLSQFLFVIWISYMVTKVDQFFMYCIVLCKKSSTGM